MTYVITQGCIDCKDGACVDCCPVDAIYEGPRTYYIHPDECIACGLCVSVCPVQAIFEECELQPPMARFVRINREFVESVHPAACGGGSVAGRGAGDHPEIT